jgi:hypothetical protein
VEFKYEHFNLSDMKKLLFIFGVVCEYFLAVNMIYRSGNPAWFMGAYMLFQALVGGYLAGEFMRKGKNIIGGLILVGSMMFSYLSLTPVEWLGETFIFTFRGTFFGASLPFMTVLYQLVRR